MSKKRKKRNKASQVVAPKKKFTLPLKILTILLAIVILGTGTLLIYSADYYKAENTVTKAELDNAGITRFETNDYIALVPSSNIESVGIILYPGAKVESEAYLTLLFKLASNGYFAAVIKSPLKLAFFDMNAANSVLSDFKSISHFYVAGHSLGGVVAGSYLKKNQDKFNGLILLGSYITADLSSSSLKTITIYGSEDGVINSEKQKENEKNLPDGYLTYVINGGNHAYFGDYGEQKGDGTATVTREYQIEQTVLAIESIILMNE